mgnify:CR=1 FL=1
MIVVDSTKCIPAVGVWVRNDVKGVHTVKCAVVSRLLCEVQFSKKTLLPFYNCLIANSLCCSETDWIAFFSV